MKRITLSLIALLVCCISMIAQQRSESEAIQIAQEFFGKQGKLPQLSVVPTQKVNAQVRKKVASARRAPAKNASFYVVNDDANNRFVIVSADERMYQILGYSDNGTFSATDAPDGLLFLLDSYDNELSLIQNSTLNQKSKRTEKKDPILPIIQSSWGQDDPYNLDCPTIKGEKKPASGCVATAMAQAMNLYKYPQKSSGEDVFYWLDSLKTFHTYKFDNVTFEWNNITNTYDENSTEAQRLEVAKLMHACGASVFMQYWTSSSANPGDIPYAMIHNFGYNQNMQYVVKDYYSSEEWNTLIENELKAGRPILYGGNGSTIFLGQDIGEGGHRFILDGMDEDGLFHFNFGWEGECDGYFAVDAINPSQLYGLITYDFNSTQGMVIGVTPETIGEPEDIFYTITLEMDTIVSVNTQTKIKYHPYCCSNLSNEQHNFTGELGIGAFDKNWNLVKTIALLDGSDLPAGSWKTFASSSYFRYDPSSFVDGSQFYVALYAKHANSQKPTLVRTKYGEKDWYRAIVKDGKVYLNRKAIIIDDGDDVIHTDPIFPKIREGLYDVSALNQKGESAKWKITLTRDIADTTLYYISNIDSALINRNIAIKDVSGKIGTDGKIKLANRQIVGNNYELNNFSGADSIEIITYPSENKMEIVGYWGVIESATGDIVSQYHETKFTPDDGIVIPNPAIIVSDQHILTINCADKEASIYYTYSANGTEPSVSSQKYTEPVSLTRNGIAKAIAIKGNLQSEVVSYEVNTFIVDKPSIAPVAEGSKTIKIECATNGASIYYSIDGKTPNTPYSGTFECGETSTIQAIAKLDGWNDSEVATYYHVVPPTPDVVIENVKGNLPNIIAENDRMEMTSLTIKGELNGTDIQLIRKMLKDGKLAYLDIEDATICSGGEPYDKDSSSEILWKYTEDNVIGSGMFSWSQSLVSIKLPSTAKVVGMSALSYNSSLKDITIPINCQEIQYNAITNCDRLETVHIPALVNKIDGSNFSDCDKLVSITVDSENNYYESTEGILFDKDRETLIKYPCGLSYETYSVPAGVRTIGERAFAGVGLSDITLPEGLIEIGTSAFSWCENLKNIVLPNSVRTMNMYAFNHCTSLSSVTLSDKLTELKTNAFGSCPNLREIHIGKEINVIEADAFADCTSIMAFYVDDENPFFTQEGGVLYTKDMSVLKIFPLALYIKEFRVPEGVKTIGEYAFRDNKNIKNIVLTESTTKIETSAFNRSAIRNINLPSNLTEIRMWAFANCKNLESIILPDGIEELSSHVFSGCENLEYLKIPSSVKKIEDYALADCKLLSEIHCGIENINSLDVDYSTYSKKYTSFDGMCPTCTWYVPVITDGNGQTRDLINEYKAQPWWVSTWNPIADGIEDVLSINDGISWNDGKLIIQSSSNGVIRVYGLNGALIHSINAKSGESYLLDLPRGMYIINNKKVVLK